MDRLKRHIAAQEKRQERDAVTSYLELELEEEKRRRLRAERELMDEAAKAARAERQRNIAEEELETLQTKLSEMEKKNERKPAARTRKSGERAGSGGEVSDGVQRVDGGAAPKRKSNAKSANRGSNPSKVRPAVSDPKPAKPGGARKRGNVK